MLLERPSTPQELLVPGKGKSRRTKSDVPKPHKLALPKKRRRTKSLDTEAAENINLEMEPSGEVLVVDETPIIRAEFANLKNGTFVEVVEDFKEAWGDVFSS